MSFLHAVGALGMLAVLLAATLVATAQTPTQSVKTVAGYLVVSACGTPPVTLTAGQYAAPMMNTAGRICVNTSAP